MNLRFPPSSLLSSKTAWAVVPEPANESRIIESFSVARNTIFLTKEDGLEYSNSLLPNKLSISFLELSF
jgi:hypothetical protein